MKQQKIATIVANRTIHPRPSKLVNCITRRPFFALVILFLGNGFVQHLEGQIEPAPFSLAGATIEFNVNESNIPDQEGLVTVHATGLERYSIPETSRTYSEQGTFNYTRISPIRGKISSVATEGFLAGLTREIELEFVSVESGRFEFNARLPGFFFQTGSGSFTITKHPQIAPTITVQPESKRIYSGGLSEFTVAVAGSPPLEFEWRRNEFKLESNKSISGFDSPTLIVHGATTQHVGSYSVFIKNSYGGVESDVAILQVIPRPRIIVIEITTTKERDVEVTFDGVEQEGYTLEWSPNLIEWDTVISGIEGQGGETRVNLFDGSRFEKRFFRIRVEE